MKSKIYLLLAVFFAAAFSAHAQKIEGTYNGTMLVDVLVPAPDEVSISGQDIIITKEDDTYKLSVLNFSFGEIPLGDLNVTGISKTEKDGIVTLSKTGMSTGPEIAELGGLATLIALNSASVNAKVLTFDISVYLDVPEIPLEAAQVANVTFAGDCTDCISSGIFAPQAGKIAVYSTIVNDMIILTGIQAADYAIYAQNGALVKAGKTNDGTINVADLGTGIYILNINENSITIIKK